jgi:DNA helicase II / ATP-dependent DNA helicase PcrA
MAYRNFRNNSAAPRRPAYNKPAPLTIDMEKRVTPSPMQQAVLDWRQNTRSGSAVVVSRAGSGKTTMAELLLHVIPENEHTTLVAFSKEIATELSARIERVRHQTGRGLPLVKATTAHALGLSVLRGGMSKNPNIKASKQYFLLKDNLPDARDLSLYQGFCQQLVGYARSEGIGCLVDNTDEAWYDLIQHHNLTLDSKDADEGRAVEIARDLLQWSTTAAKATGLIDFDDMLYLPLLWNLRFFQNDNLVVDEAQDTNKTRRAIYHASLKSTGRLIAMGDAEQSIFGFTGADSDALELVKSEFNAETLPLSVCYRCSKAVVGLAKTIVPDIEPAPNAIVGVAGDSIPVKELAGRMTERDAILCRNTAPLITLAYNFIANGKPCKILGRKIGEGLVKLVEAQKAATIIDLDKSLGEYLDREVKKFQERNEEMRAQAVGDKVQCVRSVMDNLPEDMQTVAGLIARIESMFSDDIKGLLTLATIHSVKGREYENVALYKPELIPSRYARQEWQEKQEWNLMYVAITRAQVGFYYVMGEVGKE